MNEQSGGSSTSAHARDRPVVHVWLSGQSDNVGDSMLRRVYADRLRSMGRLQVWAGDPASGYVAGLRLAPGELAPGYLSWSTRFARTAVTGNGVFAFNAGEFVPTRRYVAGVVTLLPLILLHKARGGRIVWLGAGVRRTLRGFTWPFSLLARWCDDLLWRDAGSSQLMGRGGVMPDWAFASGGEPVSRDAVGSEASEPRVQHRHRLAVALRGDREPPSDRWIEAVRALARRLRLDVVVVVQVARDQPVGEAVAARLGAELHSWNTDDHWEQEQSVRQVYRTSRLVLSDRLHALVMGATEGAVPAGWCESASDKIARHFDVVGASWVKTGAGSPCELLDELDERRLRELEAATKRAVSTARSEVDEVERRLRRRGAGVIRVLHTLAAPDGTTRYVDHMIGSATPDVQVITFSWRRAIFGSYDVLHVHWPEYLVRHRTRVGAVAKTVALRLLLARLFLTRTPVVRTAHNIAPHERGTTGEQSLLRLVDARTTLWIRLNPTTELAADARSVHIPHGHYRSVYPGSDREPTVGRILQFGLLRPYKGAESLISAFRELDDAGTSLRIIGRPYSVAYAEQLRDAITGIARAQVKLEFVPDMQLAEEVREAELVVLPYTEMHNSGAILVALSLGRPVLAPRTPANAALAEEIGEGWIHLFDGALDAEVLGSTLLALRSSARTPPNLSDRDWSVVGRRHRDAYLQALKVLGK